VGDPDELLQVLDAALSFDRPLRLEGGQVAAALEDALEQVGNVEFETRAPP
jgi:hypothetical protein